MNADYQDFKYREITEKVLYEGAIIGEYYADILVDNKVIVEIKAAKRLVEENEAQLLNK